MEGAPRPRTSIAGVLVWSLILAILIPFLPLVYLTYQGYRQDIARVEGGIQETNRQMAVLAANYVETFVERLREDARHATRGGAPVLPRATEALRWELVDADWRVQASQIDPARVGQACGYHGVLAGLGGAAGKDHSVVGKWIPGHAPTVLFGFPAGATGGHLIAVLLSEGLHDELVASVGSFSDRRLYVVDPTGLTVFYADMKVSLRGDDLSANPPVRLFLDGGSGPIRYRSTITGKDRSGYVERPSTVDWGVIVSTDIAAMVITLQDRYESVGWSIGFALVAAIAILALTSRQLVRPILQIREAVRAERRRPDGTLDVPASVVETAEYHELVREFDLLHARLKVTEAELIQAEKTALLGQLAGGIAHEFGTPLNVISGNAQYLIRRHGADPEERQVLEKIVRTSERLASMIRNVLDFARPTPAILEAVALEEVVAQALEMVSGLTKRRIETRIDLPPDLPRVHGDPRLLEHALLNLIVNACQAMPDGGTLTIDGGVGDPPGGALAPGQAAVFVRVADSGGGIAPEHLGKIFQPFFTTKAQGEGTGLGLAMVERIVKQHRGLVEVHSTVGEGTEFVVWLERAPDEPAIDAAPAARS